MICTVGLMGIFVRFRVELKGRGNINVRNIRELCLRKILKIY